MNDDMLRRCEEAARYAAEVEDDGYGGSPAVVNWPEVITAIVNEANRDRFVLTEEQAALAKSAMDSSDWWAIRCEGDDTAQELWGRLP